MKIHVQFIWCLSVLLGCACCWQSELVAQLVAPPVKTDAGSAYVVRQLLDAQWERGPENEMASQESFKSFQPATPQVQLAYVLNRIQHNKTREAIEIADQLTQNQPASLDGWLLKSWLNALVNKYDKALIDLQSLKQELVNQPDLKPETRKEILSRMGKLTGYLQGPVQEKTNPDLLSSTLKAIGENLAPDELKQFNEGRETILARYEASLKTETEKTQTELEKQQVKDEATRVNLTNQNQTFEQNLEQMSAEVARLQSEGKQRISQLAIQLSPLERDLASISSRIGSLRYDLQLLYADLLHAQEHHHSTHYVENQIRIRELDLLNLQSSYRAIGNQLQRVRNQIGQLESDYDRQIRGLEKQQKKISNTKRRNEIKLAKISGGPEIADGKKTAIKHRLNALTSYYNLSVELYRQQLLDGLK